MKRLGTIYCLTVGTALLLLCAAPVRAQQCDDADACTVNDMCSDGTCSGSFQNGGNCDDGDPCTVNDHCQMSPDSGPVCLGDQPAEVGTVCAGGCGTCQALVPLPGVPLVCTGDPANAGNPCDFGFAIPCLSGSCQITPAGDINIAFCFPQAKQCPDTDGNPCTDACDFQTGECRPDVSMCIPTCETCNPTSGACEPINEGVGCDDFDVCTPQSRCHATDLGGVTRGLCSAGEPTGPSPTPTQPSGPTATQTQSTPVPTTCVGDCDGNGVVVVNEIVTGVNIALGAAPVSQCQVFDVSGNGAVDINELVGAVNSLLGGCV